MAAETDEAHALGMDYFNVPMRGLQSPTIDTVRKVLSIIDNSPSSVFVHCEHGCDRTGAIIACYRIQRDGWSSRKALQEAKIYGMSRWQIATESFVKGFEKVPDTAAK